MSTSGGPHASDYALTLLLAALTVLLGFETGGYFADTTGWAAAGLAIALAISVAVQGRPPLGLSRPLLLTASALALFAIWTLVSGDWSGAWGRALIEFDRVLLYLLVLLLFAGARDPEWTLRRLPAAFALAALVLCAAGVFTRTLPGSWPFELPPPNLRLEYPLGYENALGALAALGLVFALHVASWRHEPRVVRALAAASLPVLAAALVLTFSRGALAAAVVGVAAYVVLGMSRGMLTTVLAAGVPVAVATKGAFDADLLGSSAFRSPAGLAQGEDLAILIGCTAVAAGLLRAVMTRFEHRIPRLSAPPVRLGVLIPVLALALAGGTAVALATVGSDAVNGIRDGGTSGGQDGGQQSGETRARDRLTNLRGQSRPKYWRIALDAFDEEPLRGAGAGEYAKLWAQDRPIAEDVTEGHSLYLETLAELGIVGCALVLIVLVCALAPFVAGLRRRSRPLRAAFVAAGAAWLLHAGLDWDWEMPVLGLWLFAGAGCALAAWGRPIGRPGRVAWPIRVGVAALCALVAITPASVALSQRRLDTAHAAFVRGDCDGAERAARDSISALSSRPEAYELLAYCAARRGDYDVALGRMGQAIDRNPDSWQLTYGLAVVRGAAGLDPRPAAREARRLNPRDELTMRAENRFATGSRRVWRREARTSPLPLLVEPRTP